MLRHSFSILTWLLDLFNAPPRTEMSRVQKLWRILLVTGTLVVLCIIAAMVGAVGIDVVQRVNRNPEDFPHLWNTVLILSAGLVVNALCVFVLFQVKRLDRKFMSGPGEKPTPP